ncbi:MAG: hypothetical protein IPL61_11755 [Myxococcales bacterium]|nr:hypothetical protein [Myxococcales bacterium]
MSAPHVLIVTSSAADPAIVVPVLAACEAAGMRVRAIDLGAVGGHWLPDRFRRALLGESAERRLRKEMDSNPPDVAVAFDPLATAALTLARDAVANPAPVVGVVGELEPARGWGETNADRVCAIDDHAAVALADGGVEGDRVLVVGAIGERAFAEAGAEGRAGLAQRFGLATRAVVVEVAGLGAEATGALALQLSLADVSEGLTFLFDAAGDVEAAAVLRRQVPVLGLRAKLFGSTADAARTWRVGDVIVARPSTRALARAALVGARLVALVDDGVANAESLARALELRGAGVGAKGTLLVSSAIEAALAAPGLAPRPDGALAVAEVIWAVGVDKRAVIEEGRAEARAATHERLRSTTTAATAAARAAAMPGELEDLGGDSAPPPPPPPPIADVDAVRAEATARKAELVRSVEAARRTADAAIASGDTARAERERTGMHRLLSELAALDQELAALDAAAVAARAAAANVGTAPPPPPPRQRPAAPPVDPLADLRRKAAGASRAASVSVDDELAALKRRMADSKKK